MGLMQGLQDGFTKLGKAAGAAIDETRIQMELMGARRRKDQAARDLGYLVYRVTQGATTVPGEQDRLVARMAEIEKQIEKLENDLKGLRAEGKGKTPPTPPSGAGPQSPPSESPPSPPPSEPPPPPPAGTTAPRDGAPTGAAGEAAKPE